jgi:hypothetical protein
MQFFHWIPGCRLYLIVKTTLDASDVDNIFKVNSMSSFTLGMFQIMGITTTILTGREFGLYIKISIGSLIFNWLITFMYYATGIPKIMASAAAASAVERHFKGLMAHWSCVQCREGTAVMNGRERDPSIEARKAKIMDKLVDFMLNKYLANGVDEDDRETVKRVLKSVRDRDVPKLFKVVRNQIIHCVDIPGGL